jgi:hypothetical protein
MKILLVAGVLAVVALGARGADAVVTPGNIEGVGHRAEDCDAERFGPITREEA